MQARHPLVASYGGFVDGLLAPLPPSLVSVDVSGCDRITPDAVLPPLPALRQLVVSATPIGDATVASLPAGLEELRMVDCRAVTGAATLDHLPALRALHACGTALAPAVLAACRARGCVVPELSVLPRHAATMHCFAQLPDGRLVCGEDAGQVRLWDVVRGGEAAGGEALLAAVGGGAVRGLAALPGGDRLVVTTGECIEVWDVACTPPAHRATISCGSDVTAVAALADGRVAAGCYDNTVRIVDVEAGAVVAELAGHTRQVLTLAVLPDGALASGSQDASVRLWDVDARVCVAVLVGHGERVRCLAVLPDGRLASGSDDKTVRLWDLGTAACVAVLAGHAGEVRALAALAVLPDGRLAAATSSVEDPALWLWDPRPAAATTSGGPAAALQGVLSVRSSTTIVGWATLPDGRLASGHEEGEVFLLTLPAPPPLPTP